MLLSKIETALLDVCGRLAPRLLREITIASIHINRRLEFIPPYQIVRQNFPLLLFSNLGLLFKSVFTFCVRLKVVKDVRADGHLGGS